MCLIKRISEDTTLVLELTSGGSCVTLPIISFPLCPSYRDVQPPVTIHNLRLETFPFDDLLLDWQGFKVTNKLTKQSLTVKTSLKVGLLNYLKVKRIINQPYFICLYFDCTSRLCYNLARNEGKSTPKIFNHHEFHNNLYPSLEPYL